VPPECVGARFLTEVSQRNFEIGPDGVTVDSGEAVLA